MLFEGNDLEDTTETPARRDSSTVVDETILESVVTLLESVRDHSIIGRALRGELHVRRAGSRVAGVDLGARLCTSDRLGDKLFHPPYIERTTKTRGYVESHPNRAVVQGAFADMKQLADRFDFRVTVVIAPSAPRVYQSHFAQLPACEDLHVARFLAALADGQGFAHVDLLPLMLQHSKEKLLFFRDDSHFNSLGHKVVAEAIISRLTSGQAHTDQVCLQRITLSRGRGERHSHYASGMPLASSGHTMSEIALTDKAD